MADAMRKKIQDQIKEQGEVVRQLKAAKADKDKVGYFPISFLLKNQEAWCFDF